MKKTYGQFKSTFEAGESRVVVIGILENTGNTHSIKEFALRQAQKTPDVGILVQNLRSVKELRCNHPVFNPEGDYVIPEGAMAIVVETHALRSQEVPDAGLEKASPDASVCAPISSICAGYRSSRTFMATKRRSESWRAR